MVQIRIEISQKGLDNLRSLVDAKGSIKTAMRDIVREGGNILKAGILKRYDAEVDPDGAPWSPLKPSTIKRKGGRGKTLVESGALRKSIRKFPRGPYQVIIRPGSHRNERIGAIHHFGTSHVPARPFMGISDQDVEAVRQLALERLRQLISASF